VPAGLPKLWLDCPNLNRQPMLQSIFDKSYSISMADPLPLFLTQKRRDFNAEAQRRRDAEIFNDISNDLHSFTVMAVYGKLKRLCASASLRLCVKIFASLCLYASALKSLR
ncbi:MAG: hypothetical protein IJS08_06270, partial [Victivallales bacterium]|nr:hypothetical protein [Victivallales bacterium]